MGTIEVLPAALASQIAAGEVVERPASALKELIENSLDAGARRCDVSIEGGGITLLSIRDDGIGMSSDDATLCLERHATSKLRRFEDLNGVRSFGFRGEALPTIASVSRFTLNTRRQEDAAGTQVVVEGGAAAHVSTVGMPVGTEVILRDLFYNVPARRKFLRSSATEAGHIADVVENAALACPDVTFTLMRDGRKAREYLRVGSRAERVETSLVGEELCQCVGERGPLMVEAYLGRPERARSGAAGLKLFCNNRPIRDRALLVTLAQAYGSILERGRYPRGVVYLDLPPELVDVNVHPQKTEVRFADARAVTDAVYHLVQAALNKGFSLPSLLVSKEDRSARAPSGPSAPAHGSSIALRDAGRASLLGAPTVREPSLLRFGDAVFRGATSTTSVASAVLDDQSVVSSVELEPGSSPAADEASPRRTTDTNPGGWGKLRFLAQVRATYLLCEGEDALYVLDQHAAAERVTFHRLREQYRGKGMTSQSLLFPLTIEVTQEQTELIESKQDAIQRLGFELRVRSETTVSLHAVPKLLQRASPERLCLDLVAELARSGRAFSDALDLMLSTMACHGSIRSGDVLSSQEADALLRALDEVDFAGHCPHGRPIVATTSWAELERRVGRR